MKFRDQACEHLSRYKVEVLRIHADGHFYYRGRNISMGHILPPERCKENILEGYRERFWSSAHSTFTPHRYFHHLNSSQALCVNLFYPLIAENALGLLEQFLSLPVMTGPRPQFEKESPIEVAVRRTSFDFCLERGAEGNVFVEVKYTEDAFRFVTWSDDLNRNSERYDSESLRSEGHRLVAKRGCVLEYLLAKDMDLIVEVTISRRIERDEYSSSSDEDARAAVDFDQVFILKRDGAIEASSGRIGTWTANHPRAGQ